MMEAEHTSMTIPYLYETIAFLLTVVIVVPLFKRIKMSPILGYLAVGAIIGPYGAAVIHDANAVQHFAELGVIILLFTIGLELSFARLKSFSKLIFGLGAAQVLVSASIISSLAFWWGNTIEAAVIIGLCLALSSTAMVMQILHERSESATTYGRASFAILLFQDLAVVPILILLTILGDTSSGDRSLWLTVGSALLKAAITIGLIIFVGRFLLSFLFRHVARLRNIDVFTALMLLVILATSVITGLAGLSMALGAFLAGLLLAETEFRHQIESEIAPFKGLFLGLFFMGVGMNLDLVMAFEYGVWVVLSVVGLLALKATIATLFARLFGLSWQDSLRTGLIVSEAGEFAFVVIGQATLSYQLIEPNIGQFMVVVAGLSMIFTPFLAMLGKWLADKYNLSQTPNAAPDALHDHIIIAGFGRVGQAVAHILTQQSIPYIALDTNADEVRRLQKQGAHIFLGDASKQEVLHMASVDNASVLLVTMDDSHASIRTTHGARQHHPELKIVVRSKDEQHSTALLHAGANQVVPETLEASLQLCAHTLQASGMSREEATACVEIERSEAYSRLLHEAKAIGNQNPACDKP